ncbi:catabolic L-serine/threonine dehydratase [Basidiobolus ranarum]|uniref:L-serine ammonia-lyase n=1 Tax=Basidiobolus ranarum TaxID=34480 RepID=A0ABR2X4U9_9FUNG
MASLVSESNFHSDELSFTDADFGFEEAESLAREFVKNTPNSKYIHPYDDPDIWEGISTMINEFSENAPFQCPDAVICPMGGGDLMSGVIEGLRNCGWAKVPVIVAETHQSNSFQASIRAGQSVKLDRPQALIKGLEIRQVCSRALELAFMHPSLPLSVTDSMAADACCKFADDHQMIVDAGTGAALSVLYSRSIQKFLPNLDENMNIVVVITGGVDISLETLIQYKEQYSNPPILVKSDSGVFMRMQDVPDIDSD